MVNLVRQLWCSLMRRHVFAHSRKHEGRRTCINCGLRIKERYH